MKEEINDLDPTGTYLVACTFGPDSMALLDMTISHGVKPIVCFVNYHTEDSMEDEQKKMIEYAEEKGLTLEILDANTVSQEGRTEDFSAWARTTRYAFFKKIYEQYNATALLVAHSQDDLLEGFLTQKKLGKQLDRFGITKISSYDDMIVMRPLLDFTKEDLIEYDHEHGVPFSAHMSYYEDEHTRSKIRNEVSHLNEIERDQMMREMMAVNDQKINFIKGISQDIQESEELSIRDIIALDEDEFASALIHFVRKAPNHIVLSAKKLSEIRKMCLDPEPNITMKLKDNYYLVKEYDIISLENNPEELPYTFMLEKPGKLSTPNFDLDFSMGAEDRNIKESDYPLTIRTAIPGDLYIYGGYMVPLRRMYLDANMPLRLRHVWPVFLNKDGKIVYVPRYRKSFTEYHTSILKIHVKEEEK